MKNIQLTFFPVLASFGPCFIVIVLWIGQQGRRENGQSIMTLIFAFLGGLMVNAALMILFWEIVSLRKLIEAKTEKD